MNENSISVSITASKTRLKDIVVRIEEIGWQKRVDSFYFLLDGSRTSFAVLPGRLAKLFEDWLTILEKDTPVHYLPISFSEQFIGAFSVQQTAKEEVSLSYGYLEGLIGSDVPPSKIKELDLTSVQFIQSYPELDYAINASRLKANIAKLILEMRTLSDSTS
ncbi:MAG: hypothetical protein AAFO03_07430 [Bacteroidota bacterium]